MSVLDLLLDAGHMAGRGAREVAGMAPLGALMGGASAAASGGDAGQIGRGALYGVGGLAGTRLLAHLPGALKLLALPGAMLPAVAGGMAVHGDVDAAARKILEFSSGDPARMERAAAILYGDYPTEGEVIRGGRHHRNIYGIADADIMGSQTSGTQRDAALARAREMLAQRQQGH